MSERTTVPPAAGQVRSLIHGRWRAQVLACAVRLGIPELLRDGPCSASSVATSLGADADAVARLLILLAGLGVLTSGPSGYELADDARRLLADHPATVARDAAYTLSGTVAAAWDGLVDVVLGARPAVASFPDEAAAVLDYRAGVARRNLAALMDAVDLPTHGVVAVVGSANAPILSGIEDAAPSVSVVLVHEDELPAGLPSDAALYVFAHVLHDMSDDDARTTVSVLAGRMAATSDVVIIAADPAQDDQLLPAYLDVAQMLSGDGRERTAAEYATMLAAAGLRLAGTTRAAARPGIQVLRACPA